MAFLERFQFIFRTDSPTTPGLTLEYASLCLKNALSLLPEDPLDAAPPSGDDPEPR